MTVGSQTNQGNVNQNLTVLALQWRDLATGTLEQADFLNKLGQGGLESLGFTAQDAAEVLTLIDYMGTCAGVYKGTATQGSEFDFEDALTPLWGGG